jgi:proteic killer suppression protein
VIKTCKDRRTEALFAGEYIKGTPSDVAKRAHKKLLQLDAAGVLDDMKVPPGNKLHELGGDRAGTWSIWVNEQWRITFKWVDGSPTDVCFEDYHDD